MKLIDILSIALAVSAALTFGTIFIIFLRKALKKKEPVLATPYDPEKIARSIIGSQTQEGFLKSSWLVNPYQANVDELIKTRRAEVDSELNRLKQQKGSAGSGYEFAQ